LPLFRLEVVKNTWPVSSGPGVDYPANPLLS